MAPLYQAAAIQGKQDEEKKLSSSGFWTAFDRNETLRNKVELTKFGEVAIAFRLSTPDPNNYTYYTELPSECHEGIILWQYEEQIQRGSTIVMTVLQNNSC